MHAHDWIVVGVEIASGLAAAALARVLLRHTAARVARTAWRGDDVLVALVRVFLPWALLLGGVWAAALTLPLSDRWRADADRVLSAAMVLAATFAVARGAGLAVRSGALARSGVSGSASIFVHIARAAVLAVGCLIALESLGVSITPLLTALGVGGLAVALALQDTLTNLFAGIHILASRKVQPGDFIQLDGGQQGYVVDTNWRNTVIRQLPDNLVIVPNAVLAASVLTNYHRPVHEMSVLVQVGVSYDSDLEHVERVTCEVGREVMRQVDGAVAEHEPFIRYHTFGESSIDFSVILRASEVTSQYMIVHEFIKRLHRRYRAEGIEIPFPIRTLVPAAGGSLLGEPPTPRDGHLS
ncbi:mechanosensitive ion channel family protein [Actinocrinis puniceicyclus]|uniref:Mechanosensitive ion channel family protein n=1 Tax=Actinocrinis puniceicyclus TaxID=977794 RepID=A0A8J7WM73_9ACTN|nr:mechanosensitive ion channel family protein [Actinocrinis puniceicyclus]MBS2962237.1 mechanosensitive ion channel family protein [Actinocrinis puniceicyclus]